MNKTIVFDMDGTIADLYGVKGWLDMLHNEDTTPYKICKALVDMVLLTDILRELKEIGYKIVVTTWTAKNGSYQYNKATAKVKKTWLDNFGFPYDEFYAVKYGTKKMNCTKQFGGFQILFDDSAEVRKTWKCGVAINPVEIDIIEYLIGLL